MWLTITGWRRATRAAGEPGGGAEPAGCALMVRRSSGQASLFGAVLLVVSELVANAVRHAHKSPDAEVTLEMTEHLLVVGVGDLDPRPMTLATAERASGQGLRTVAELARVYGGDVRVEPAGERGKSIVVRFILPEGTP
ncbi:ATP-binding protein [Streptomyces sp. 5.8]|uniref:ATP-binding protein n=1 Tax=Streptomyces sp. 5.8 TaxID=3406571 RepID=UPI003BB5A4A0